MTQDSQAPPTDLFTRLLDDAAIFPPGNMALADAVPAHHRHRHASYTDLVGSFVLAAKDLEALRSVTGDMPPGSLAVSLTTPEPDAAAVALAAAGAVPAVRLTGLEVAVPAGVEVVSVVPTLRKALDGRRLPTYIEVPRDSRREPLLRELAGTPYAAKFRTGGVRRELYPDESELAGSVLAAVRAGVPFKATAGLHHTLRNTDPETGFEQHGFLNLLTATAAAVDGADATELIALLAERDPDRVAEAVRRLDPSVRETFLSFGTCSVLEPVTELVELGLLPEDHTTEVSP